MAIKNCVVCGVEFEARTNGVCCSANCRNLRKYEQQLAFRISNADVIRERNRLSHARLRATNPEKTRNIARLRRNDPALGRRIKAQKRRSNARRRLATLAKGTVCIVCKSVFVPHHGHVRKCSYECVKTKQRADGAAYKSRYYRENPDKRYAVTHPEKAKESYLRYERKRLSQANLSDLNRIFLQLAKRSVPMSLKTMTLDQVWNEFREGLADGAKGLRRMAAAWVELKNRGEDLSDYTNPMFQFFPDVEAGKLDPEMLIIYGSARPAILAKLTTLVPEDQKRLISGDGKIDIVDTPNSEPRRVKVMDLHISKLSQVIDSETGTIRTPAQQRRHIAPTRSRSTRRAEQLRDDSDCDLCTVLSAAELNQLRDVAEKSGRTPAEHARWVFIKFRVIKEDKRSAPRKAAAKRPGARPSAHAP